MCELCRRRPSAGRDTNFAKPAVPDRAKENALFKKAVGNRPRTARAWNWSVMTGEHIAHILKVQVALLNRLRRLEKRVRDLEGD